MVELNLVTILKVLLSKTVQRKHKYRSLKKQKQYNSVFQMASLEELEIVERYFFQNRKYGNEILQRDRYQ